MLASLDAATPEADIRPAQPDADVFELTDEMALPDPAAGGIVQQDRACGRHRIQRARAAKARQPAYEPPPFESAEPLAQQILSRSTVSAVESAFNSLANTVLSNNARTLEDLVKEMLRPMLKSWLDDNLPGLVERIVKAESNGFHAGASAGAAPAGDSPARSPSRRRDHGSSAALDRLVRLTCGAVAAF